MTVTFLMCCLSSASPSLLSSSSSELPWNWEWNSAQGTCAGYTVAAEARASTRPDLKCASIRVISVVIVVRCHLCITARCRRCLHFWIVYQEHVQSIVQLQALVCLVVLLGFDRLFRHYGHVLVLFDTQAGSTHPSRSGGQSHVLDDRILCGARLDSTQSPAEHTIQKPVRAVCQTLTSVQMLRKMSGMWLNISISMSAILVCYFHPCLPLHNS